MSIIGWIIIGLTAGFVASKIVNRNGAGLFMDIAIGVVGALLGGILFNWLGIQGTNGFSVWSFFVAVIGAVVLLLVVNLLRRSS